MPPSNVAATPSKSLTKGPTHRQLGAVAAVVASVLAYHTFNGNAPTTASAPADVQIINRVFGGELPTPTVAAAPGVSKVSTPSVSAPVPALSVNDVGASCTDLSRDCTHWASAGECTNNADFMRTNCPAACGTCGAASAADNAVPWSDAARAARQRAYPKCRDKAPECPLWAASGECKKNPTYMQVSCALSCDTCDWAVFETRCKKDPSVPLTVKPGELDAMFREIETKFAHFKPRVLSQPPEPWLVVFDEFLEPEVADAIVEVSTREAGKFFTPSHGTGGLDSEGQLIPTTSSYRTSSTNWCQEGCLDTPPMKHLRERVVSVTGVPDENHEYPQMLRYYDGQYYKIHSDYIPAHKDMPCGPRIYTLFVYLTDVEEGGHTSFPQLNMSVKPKKGRAVLWPSVFDDQPTSCDMRTQHIAEPVVNGTKYSVNFWLHQHDFKAANAIGCTG